MEKLNQQEDFYGDTNLIVKTKHGLYNKGGDGDKTYRDKTL